MTGHSCLRSVKLMCVFFLQLFLIELILNILDMVLFWFQLISKYFYLRGKNLPGLGIEPSTSTSLAQGFTT